MDDRFTLVVTAIGVLFGVWALLIVSIIMAHITWLLFT